LNDKNYVHNLFTRFGEIGKVICFKSKNSADKGKLMAYIFFLNTGVAQAAINEMNGK